MDETERRKKKRKKRTLLVREEQTEESLWFSELIKVLEELEKKRKFIDVQVCPKCKSPRVHRVKTMQGDLWRNLGFSQSLNMKNADGGLVWF